MIGNTKTLTKIKTGQEKHDEPTILTQQYPPQHSRPSEVGTSAMPLPQFKREYSISAFGSYKNMTVNDQPIYPPKPYDVLVKIHAVALNYRDLVVSGGFYAGNARTPDNLIPCSDMAGEITALGEGVTQWKVGDRVCANFIADFVYGDIDYDIQQSSMGGQAQGVLTQYRTFHSHSLVKFPDFWSYEEASTLPGSGLTAYNALYGPKKIKAGDCVLLLGTGGVSIFGLQFALAAGATVIVTSSSDDKLQIASKLGAQHVINYKKNPNWDEEVLKITNGVGVDHVLEVGGDGTLSRSINAVKMAGYVHVIGFISKESTTANIAKTTIRKGIILRGIQIGSLEQFKDMIRLIVANPEKTRPVIDKVFTFEEVMDAFAYLESQQQVGKIVIKVA